MMERDLVNILEDLESGFEPLYYVAPNVKVEVRLPEYDKPEAGVVRILTKDEIALLNRSRVIRKK